MLAGVRTLQRVGAIATIGFGILGSSAAMAQVIVLQSSVAKYKTGSTLAKSAQVSIPEGGTMVVVLPSGATRTITGPFNGGVAGLATGGGRSNAALFNAVKKFVKTGGATSKNVGALRSVRSSGSAPKPTTAKIPFSWSQVPLNVKGDICLSKVDGVSLYRESAKSAQAVTLIDLTTTARTSVTFAAGSSELPWPVELELKDGNYAISPKGRRMSQVRIRLIDPLPSAEQTLQVLYGQRCFRQFQAYLDLLRTDVAAQQQ